jgi:TonB family protein
MPRLALRATLPAAALLCATQLHAQTPAPAAPPSAPAAAQSGPAATAAAHHDSAQAALRQRFAAEVLTAARAAGTPAGLVVFAADPASGSTELKLARASVAESALADAVEHVRAELKAVAAGGPFVWHVRLDSVPPLAPGARTRQPVIANPREARLQVNRFVEQHFADIFQGRRGMRVDLQLVVAREGDVAYARVARSSGNAAVDQAALQIASTLRFQPATVGTQPVDARINFPLYFVVGEA